MGQFYSANIKVPALTAPMIAGDIPPQSIDRLAGLPMKT
jgi:hypothetical protein